MGPIDIWAQMGRAQTGWAESAGYHYLTLTSTCKLTFISAYFINMNELNDNIAADDDDEFIDPDLLSYSTSTRGGEQLIYLNKVYQIKRNSLTHNGNYKVIWQCKDRAMCRGILDKLFMILY